MLSTLVLGVPALAMTTVPGALLAGHLHLARSVARLAEARRTLVETRLGAALDLAARALPAAGAEDLADRLDALREERERLLGRVEELARQVEAPGADRLSPEQRRLAAWLLVAAAGPALLPALGLVAEAGWLAASGLLAGLALGPVGLGAAATLVLGAAGLAGAALPAVGALASSLAAGVGGSPASTPWAEPAELAEALDRALEHVDRQLDRLLLTMARLGRALAEGQAVEAALRDLLETASAILGGPEDA